MTVTLYPNGVSNANIASLGGTFPAPDPTRVASFFDDFYNLDTETTTTAAVWRVLGTGATKPTAASAAYGRALIAPVTQVTDMTYLQLASQTTVAAGSLPVNFVFTANRDFWFQTLFQVSQATLSVINAGFFINVAATGVAPESVADYVGFTKVSGSTTLNLIAKKTAGATTTLAVATLSDATDIKVGFHYNANSARIFAYVNDQRVGSMVADNVPTVGLLPLIGHQNNTANRTSSWDYVHAAQARQAETAT